MSTNQLTRIGFVTGHRFGIQALQGILSSDEYLGGRITIPLAIGLSPDLKGNTVGYERLIDWTSHLADCTSIETRDGRLTSHLELLQKSRLDYLLIIGWSRLVAAEVRKTAHRLINGSPGAIGMHPTPLPIGRGRAPIPWTILHGLTSTALSVFVLEDTADSGGIIDQLPISVRENETSASLFARINQLHYEAGVRLSKLMTRNAWRITVQDEADATWWPKRIYTSGLVEASMKVDEVLRLFRAQQFPYPPAFYSGPEASRRVIRGVYQRSREGTEKCEFQDGPLWLLLEAVS